VRGAPPPAFLNTLDVAPAALAAASEIALLLGCLVPTSPFPTTPRHLPPNFQSAALARQRLRSAPVTRQGGIGYPGLLFPSPVNGFSPSIQIEFPPFPLFRRENQPFLVFLCSRRTPFPESVDLVCSGRSFFFLYFLPLFPRAMLMSRRSDLMVPPPPLAWLSRLSAARRSFFRRSRDKPFPLPGSGKVMPNADRRLLLAFFFGSSLLLREAAGDLTPSRVSRR